MTRLINTPLFRSVLVASCMLTGDVTLTPSSRPVEPDSSHPQPTVMKVASDNEPNRKSRSTKKKCRSVVDSGATVHCIRDKSLFTHLDTSKSVRIRVADNRVINSEGVGTCAIKLKSSKMERITP